MALTFRPFVGRDLLGVEVQGRHREARDMLILSGRAPMLEGPYAWTAVDQVALSPAHVRFKTIACGGIYQPGDRYPALAWAFLGPDMRQYMVPITRMVKMVVEEYPDPVFAEIDESFPAGVRWAKMLGFFPYGRWLWTHDAHLS